MASSASMLAEERCASSTAIRRPSGTSSCCPGGRARFPRPALPSCARKQRSSTAPSPRPDVERHLAAAGDLVRAHHRPASTRHCGIRARPPARRRRGQRRPRRPELDHHAPQIAGRSPPGSPPWPDTGRQDRDQPGLERRLQRPEQAVGDAQLVPGVDRLLGRPERHDVVVGLVLDRDLDQAHRALAPGALGLDPQVRPPVEARVEVAIGRDSRARAAAGRSRAGSRRRTR